MPEILAPLKEMLPDAWGNRPVIALNSVVLPAPFGPIKPVVLPRFTEKLAPSSACSPPKVARTPVTSKRASMSRRLGGACPRSHLIFEEAAIFHDRSQTLALASEHADVLEGVAFDDQKIRDRARANHAQTAGVLHDLARSRRRAAQRFEVANDLGTHSQFFALVTMRLAEQVAAEAHLDAHAIEQGDGVPTSQAHVINLRDGLWWKAELGAFKRQHIEGDQCRHNKDFGTLQQLGRRLIDQVAVLNRSYPGLNGALDSLGGVGVCHHIGLPSIGLGDDGPELLHRITGIADGVIGRGNATAGHHLDLRCTLGQLLTGCKPNRVDAIRHTTNVAEPEGACAGFQLVTACPEISMATGLRKRLTRRK